MTAFYNEFAGYAAKWTRNLIAAWVMRAEIREAGQRGVSLARLRQEGRERLSAIVAGLEIVSP